MLRRTWIILCALYVWFSPVAQADEGMWLLPHIREHNLEAMQLLGFQLDAEDIYSPGETGIYSAVVNVGNVGSGSVVSNRGLVLTNHHVVYDHLQRISTLDNDILTDGFWAGSLEEEIPLRGLTASFLREISDVSDVVAARIAAHREEHGEDPTMRLINRQITREATAGTHFQAYVMSFFRGTKQLLFVYEVFEDIRLVGAPPSSIGKFGGDTDNFMWPRHTGDFAYIRIYAGDENLPAAYNEYNQPYLPLHFLALDGGGVQDGDFAMTLGYPGSSQRYISSFAVEELLHVTLPARILAREKRLDIIHDAMLADDEVRLNYAATVFNSANGLKLAQGQYEQLSKNDVADIKRAEEKTIAAWLSDQPDGAVEYMEALSKLQYATGNRQETLFAHQLLNESLLMGTEIYVAGIRASIFGRIYEDDAPGEAEVTRALERLHNSQSGFYDAYSPETDREVTKAMLRLVREQLDEAYLPGIFNHIDLFFDGCSDRFSDHMFDHSFLADKHRFQAFLDNPDPIVLREDPVIRYAMSVYDKAIELRDQNNALNPLYAQGQDIYLETYRQFMADTPLYPDANFTMRMSYGTVSGYSPRDAVYYDYYTTLDGVFEKEDPDHHEFVVPQRLHTLNEAGGFEPYGQGGVMPVAFISNNDITGGNSGSPVLNAHGQVSGLVFCGSWESLNNNVIYTDETNRSINVDIRYVLFITDRFARSSHIMEELQIVW